MDRSSATRALRFWLLVFAALGLAPGAAHVMELPVKMGYAPELYAAVTSTLYALYGSVGAATQVAALLCSAWATFRLRKTASFRSTLSGTLLLGLSLVLWTALVAPVNAEWAHAFTGPPEAIPAAYARLRARWEYGHVATFVAWLAGFCVLLLSVLRDHGRSA